MSRALTAIAAMQRLGITEEKASRATSSPSGTNTEFCIHLLGCDVIGEGATAKDTVQTFSPMFLELVKHFEARAIEITLLLNGVNFNMEEQSLSVSEGLKGIDKLTLVYCPGLYHESQLAKSYPPDILLAFNAGIWGYDDWLPTLRYILKSDTSNLNRVPLVITSYNRLEAEDDEDVLLKLLKSSGAGEEADKLAVDKHCVWGTEKNQHPDESSRRKSTHEGELLTDNAYWMCYIGQKKK